MVPTNNRIIPYTKDCSIYNTLWKTMDFEVDSDAHSDRPDRPNRVIKTSLAVRLDTRDPAEIALRFNPILRFMPNTPLPLNHETGAHFSPYQPYLGFASPNASLRRRRRATGATGVVIFASCIRVNRLHNCGGTKKNRFP